MTAALPGVTVAAVVAAALEKTLGEPPSRYHPVALFGRVVERVESPPARAPGGAGVLVALGLPTGGAAAAYGLVAGVSQAAPLASGVLAAVAAGVVLWSVSSLRLLVDAAGSVVEASETDLEAARERLPALVGREPTELSPELVRSGAVESLAENLSDGLVAPLLAFAAGAAVSLPAAAAAAAFLKAANTMDSMLGYPGAYGWGSARLDDLLMFVPARVTAALLGIATGDPDAPLRARRDADAPASPNAGWPMGTIAAGLTVRLEKPDAYTLNGVADYPTVADARRAVTATQRAGAATYGGLALVGVVL